jgi:argininosuccinate synthase
MTAHKVLEDITLPSEVVDVQRMLSNKLAKIVLEGEWFTDFRDAICAFFDSMQKHVNGTIRLKLYKGGITVMRRKAEGALYDRELVSSDKEGSFPAHDMEKFINVVKASKKVEKDFSTKKL